MKFQDFVEKHKTNEPTPHTLFKNATKEIQNKSGNSSIIKRKIDQISTDENQNENEDETENVKKNPLKQQRISDIYNSTTTIVTNTTGNSLNTPVKVNRSPSPSTTSSYNSITTPKLLSIYTSPPPKIISPPNNFYMEKDDSFSTVTSGQQKKNERSKEEEQKKRK